MGRGAKAAKWGCSQIAATIIAFVLRGFAT
jgi:hypothetical protein